ncbi:MAG TPA: YbhB/YbcL family Raf kinase inhibitor-like protein [Puia sp.]|jgi:Raf kinase inhibitor-like YbhB/YbcL family protein|nr:YbhB/YbcL family Raf kinase inhibitor-like protein [Puia sp.]
MATVTDVGLKLQSPAFKDGEDIPRRFTCEGENVNPSLEITGLPRQTRTLALIVEDPDTGHGVFDHWLVWNIQPNETIRENNVPGVYGRNGFGKNGYGGPCPPQGKHRYFFHIYALDGELDLPPGSSKKELQAAMQGHILATADLMGQYEKGK